jgi:hypothetical protein
VAYCKAYRLSSPKTTASSPLADPASAAVRMERTSSKDDSGACSARVSCRGFIIVVVHFHRAARGESRVQ